MRKKHERKSYQSLIKGFKDILITLYFVLEVSIEALSKPFKILYNWYYVRVRKKKRDKKIETALRSFEGKREVKETKK